MRAAEWRLGGDGPGAVGKVRQPREDGPGGAGRDGEAGGEARRGVAGRRGGGAAWRGGAGRWRGVAARRDGVAARRGVARRGVARRGVARRGVAWRGVAWRDGAARQAGGWVDAARAARPGGVDGPRPDVLLGGLDLPVGPVGAGRAAQWPGGRLSGKSRRRRRNSARWGCRS
ncbi:hypothetical protein Asp14428_26460 [Actinoplanes sp. NBRC 14428]|nr:hypothetical protein Asp14428_26460 [Actinoplanes sp. NBRC 14428]